MQAGAYAPFLRMRRDACRTDCGEFLNAFAEGVVPSHGQDRVFPSWKEKLEKRIDTALKGSLSTHGRKLVKAALTTSPEIYRSFLVMSHFLGMDASSFSWRLVMAAWAACLKMRREAQISPYLLPSRLRRTSPIGS